MCGLTCRHNGKNAYKVPTKRPHIKNLLKKCPQSAYKVPTRCPHLGKTQRRLQSAYTLPTPFWQGAYTVPTPFVNKQPTHFVTKIPTQCLQSAYTFYNKELTKCPHACKSAKNIKNFKKYHLNAFLMQTVAWKVYWWTTYMSPTRWQKNIFKNLFLAVSQLCFVVAKFWGCLPILNGGGSYRNWLQWGTCFVTTIRLLLLFTHKVVTLASWQQLLHCW